MNQWQRFYKEFYLRYQFNGVINVNLGEKLGWKHQRWNDTEDILRPQFADFQSKICDPVLDKWNQNQWRPTKLSDRQKRNILCQARVLQEEVGNFSMKTVMVKAGIPPSVSIATVHRVLRKEGLKWSHAHKKGVLTKSDLKLRLKFAWEFRWKLPKKFRISGVGFDLDRASFTHKMNHFDKVRAPRAMEKAWTKIRLWLHWKGKPWTNRRGRGTRYGSYRIWKRGNCSRTVLWENWCRYIFFFCSWTLCKFCLRNALTQKENCFCKTEIHHKIVVKPDLLGIK